MRIDLNRGAIARDGFMFLPDSADRKLWYVLPNRPSLRRQPTGQPTELLNKSRTPDGKQGVLLHMELEVGAPAGAVSDALRGALKGAGTVYVRHLAPLRVFCDVIVPAGTGSERSLITTDADVTSPFSASVETELTPQGTAMMEAALRGDAPGPFVVYRFHVLAQLPRVPVRVEVNWPRATDFLATRFGRERVMRHSEISDAVTQLVEAGQVRFQSLDDRPEGAREAVEHVTALIASKLCKPAGRLPPSDPQADHKTSEVTSSLQYAGYTLLGGGTPDSVARYDLEDPQEVTVLLTVVDTLASLMKGTVGVSGPPLSSELQVVTDPL